MCHTSSRKHLHCIWLRWQGYIMLKCDVSLRRLKEKKVRVHHLNESSDWRSGWTIDCNQYKPTSMRDVHQCSMCVTHGRGLTCSSVDVPWGNILGSTDSVVRRVVRHWFFITFLWNPWTDLSGIPSHRERGMRDREIKRERHEREMDGNGGTQ